MLLGSLRAKIGNVRNKRPVWISTNVYHIFNPYMHFFSLYGVCLKSEEQSSTCCVS